MKRKELLVGDFFRHRDPGDVFMCLPGKSSGGLPSMCVRSPNFAVGHIYWSPADSVVFRIGAFVSGESADTSSSLCEVGHFSIHEETGQVLVKISEGSDRHCLFMSRTGSVFFVHELLQVIPVDVSFEEEKNEP